MRIMIKNYPGDVASWITELAHVFKVDSPFVHAMTIAASMSYYKVLGAMRLSIMFLSLSAANDAETSTSLVTEEQPHILEDPSTLVNRSDTTFHPIWFLDHPIDLLTEVTFHLFTNANKDTACLLRLGDPESLRDSSLDPTVPTKVIVHGWTDNLDAYWYRTYRNNYLTSGNYNVIFVDWSSLAGREYFTSSRLTRPVGEYLGKFLTFLEENANVSLSTVHILGHSLGAHVAGFAGSSVLGKVGRITGMDPASPAFEVPFLTDVEDRLDPTDAKFVDVIHTCSGTAGFTLPVGHVDFYPNGGTFPQPGCPPIASQFCSHGRSHQFMSDSIIRPRGFLSLRCKSWREFASGRCIANESETAFMGEILSNETRGSFYLRTNSHIPFGQNDH